MAMSSGSHNEWMERVIDHCVVEDAGLRAGHSILDVGFRRFAALQALAEIVRDNGSVTGVDIDSQHVAEAQTVILEGAWSNIRVTEGSVLDLPFQDGSFDVVLCSGILHEIRNLDRAFRELARVIRPDGRIAIADFNRFSRLKFLLYRAQHRLRGEPCLDVHSGFSHQRMETQLEASGLIERSYRILPEEWTMGFIRTSGFLILAQRQSTSNPEAV